MNARRDTLFTAWNRRQFLRASGLTVAGGSLLAACGGGGAENGIPRVGTVPPTTGLPDAPLTDITLLRTATSLEYNALYVYNAVASLNALNETASALATRFAADHTAHAEGTAALTEQLGGEAFNCPNPRLQSVYIEPAMRLILGSKQAADALGIEAGTDELEPSEDIVGDILTLANALESLAAATYQAVVVLLNDKGLRAEAMRIGAQEAQHAALLGAVVNPTALINVDAVALPVSATPTTTTTAAPTGLPTTVASPDVTEAPVAAAPTPMYAVPSTFGLLSPISIQLGKANDSGIRTTVNLETPSLNSMAYEYMGACEA